MMERKNELKIIIRNHQINLEKALGRFEPEKNQLEVLKI